jgi:hypothetical protein
MVLKIGKKD